jgi:hypothetical protein
MMMFTACSPRLQTHTARVLSLPFIGRPASGCFSWFRSGIRADDANELVGQTAELAERSVDAMSETGRVRWIMCAGDDSLVRGPLPMKASEVGVIMSKHRTLVRYGTGKNNIIAKALSSLTCVLDGADIMPQAAELLDNRQREVLIRIESGHRRLICLVILNVLVDLACEL